VMTINYRRKFVGSMILLCLITFAFNAQAEGDFIDKIKSVSIEGVTVNKIKNNDKKIVINGTAKNNKVISEYMRTLDSEVGSPNLEYIKKDKKNGAMSTFAISIKKPKK